MMINCDTHAHVSLFNDGSTYTKKDRFWKEEEPTHTQNTEKEKKLLPSLWQITCVFLYVYYYTMLTLHVKTYGRKKSKLWNIILVFVSIQVTCQPGICGVLLLWLGSHSEAKSSKLDE